MKVPKGQKLGVGGKTYRAGEEIPERHAKLLTISHPKPAPKAETNKK